MREQFIITDRTEHEAERQAEADPRVLRYSDWTMTACVPETLDKNIERF